jgi:5-methyltetrahydropteroyltriglutamate--homocysteine methyltransferase
LASQASRPAEAFMTAASPGTLCSIFGEGYYPTYDAYLSAMADAMGQEYKAITDAGLVLQVDAPDLVIESHRKFQDLSTEEFLGIVALHIDAINQAIAGLPREQIRLHVCWGNGPRPHTTDIPLKDIIHILLRARVGALSIEASNPRHEHEWRVFETVKLPDDLLIIPGVIDSTTNYVEHPELVAERITRLARLVGRNNVLAGSDCGFGTGAGRGWVAPSVVWAKLRSLAEGARLASQELW